MDRERKESVVAEIVQELQSSEAVYAVDYRGLSVSQAAELRGRLHDADTKFRIVKNSLSERAADAAGLASLKELLEGPTALALVRGDAALAAKALNEAARSLGILEFKGGLMGGEALSADEIRSIARLPGREVLHGQLVGTIASPLGGLVRGLNALIGGLAIQLQQIAEKGLVEGEAAEGSGAEAPEGDATAEAAEGSGAEAPEGDATAEAAEVSGAEAPEGDATAEAAEGSGAEATTEDSDQQEQDAAPDAEPSDAQEE